MTDERIERLQEALEPCPFCGSSASTMRGRGWSAACDGGVHDCDVAPATTEFATEAEAIAAWNTRAALTTPSEGDGAGEGERMSRFGHHPDPAIDFCVEVESLESIVADKLLGMRDEEPWPLDRITRAMEFRVGGDVNAVSAKHVLRQLEQKVLATLSPRPPVDAEGLVEAIGRVEQRLATMRAEHERFGAKFPFEKRLCSVEVADVQTILSALRQPALPQSGSAYIYGLKGCFDRHPELQGRITADHIREALRDCASIASTAQPALPEKGEHDRG